MVNSYYCSKLPYFALQEIYMKSRKETPSKEVPASKAPFFEKTNLLWMLGGAVLIVIGFLLMAGGRSDDPNVFRADEVYSSTRITIAPILILAGMVIEIFAIFRNPK
jgi:hypothetical protein